MTKRFSKNPVQNRTIKTLLYANPPIPVGMGINKFLYSNNYHLGFKAGEDIYDFANYIVSLEKTIKILMEDLIDSAEGSKAVAKKYLEAARHDWQGKYKIY